MNIVMTIYISQIFHEGQRLKGAQAAQVHLILNGISYSDEEVIRSSLRLYDFEGGAQDTKTTDICPCAWGFYCAL